MDYFGATSSATKIQTCDCSAAARRYNPYGVTPIYNPCVVAGAPKEKWAGRARILILFGQREFCSEFAARNTELARSFMRLFHRMRWRPTRRRCRLGRLEFSRLSKHGVSGYIRTGSHINPQDVPCYNPLRLRDYERSRQHRHEKSHPAVRPAHRFRGSDFRSFTPYYCDLVRCIKPSPSSHPL